ncbi:MAG: DUF2304 domain-containing protein [Bacteroidota bacterium]
MRPIQFILIPLLLFALINFWLRLRDQPLMRVLIALVLILGVSFVLFPDASTLLANALGVGRGADMVIYLTLTGLTIGIILLYLRILRLEQQLTEVIRHQAIAQAQKPEAKL